MHDWTPITVAVIGAITAITGSYWTAQSTANSRVNEINTQVQVLQERQELQYSELKGEVSTIKTDVKEILRAVK